MIGRTKQNIADFLCTIARERDFGKRMRKAIYFFIALLLLGSGCIKRQNVRFPKVQRYCTQHIDCIADAHYIKDGKKCCTSCTYRAVRKVWQTKMYEICDTLTKKGCPDEECPPPTKVLCTQGVCKILPRVQFNPRHMP